MQIFLDSCDFMPEAKALGLATTLPQHLPMDLAVFSAIRFNGVFSESISDDFLVEAVLVEVVFF